MEWRCGNDTVHLCEENKSSLLGICEKMNDRRPLSVGEAAEDERALSGDLFRLYGDTQTVCMIGGQTPSLSEAVTHK